MKVCEAMIEEGHDVRLIAPSLKTDTRLKGVDPIQFYGLRHATKPVFHGLPPSHLGRAWYAMRGRLSSLGRTAYTRNGSVAAICVNTGAPTVLELHGPPLLKSPADFILKRLLSMQSPRLRIVVITEALRQMLAERYPLADVRKFVVAPDGVDPTQFADLPNRQQARQMLNLPMETTIVGHIGSLSPTNGVEILSQLVSRLPDIHFVMVGDRGRGEGLNHVREAARNSGGTGNLTTPGNINNSEVPLWMSACDILLLANRIVPGWENRNALWTSPLKMFEYMASGRPIISSDLPVLREILDEKTAVLVPSDDIDAWIEAIRHLKKCPRSAIALGEAARQKVINSYSWRARVRTCLDGLEQWD